MASAIAGAGEPVTKMSTETVGLIIGAAMPTGSMARP